MALKHDVQGGRSFTTGLPTQASIDRAGNAWMYQMRVSARLSISSHSPRRTGAIVDHLSKSTGKTAGQGGGFVESLGEIKPLRVDKSAPPNTIYDFLMAYHSARMAKRGGGRGSWLYAWYFLKNQDKSALFGLRSPSGGGQFGGPHPPPTYLEAINSGKVLRTFPPGSGAIAKLARYQGFMDRIRQEVESRRDGIARSISV